jgi:hypothetical protein
MNPHPKVQDTKRDWSQCAYCGATDQPMRAKDVKIAPHGYAWWLAAACSDVAACAQRIRERDAHLDQRWTLTLAGREALAAAGRVEVAS